MELKVYSDKKRFINRVINSKRHTVVSFLKVLVVKIKNCPPYKIYFTSFNVKKKLAQFPAYVPKSVLISI